MLKKGKKNVGKKKSGKKGLFNHESKEGETKKKSIHEGENVRAHSKGVN